MNVTHQKLDLLLAMGKYREALKLAQEAVGREPAWANGYTQMARAYAGLGEYKAALDAARQGVKRDPQDAWGLRFFALTLAVAGQIPDALDAATEAARCDPDEESGFVTLALMLHLSGRCVDALATAEAGLQIAPENWQLLLARGRALYDLGRVDEAEECAEAGRSLVPTESDFHEFLGLIHERRAATAHASYASYRRTHFERAEAALHEARRLNPTDAAVHRRLQDLRRRDRWAWIDEWVEWCMSFNVY